MVNNDPMVEHERLQATVHMMTAFVAYKVKSPLHSLIIARINEHVSTFPRYRLVYRVDGNRIVLFHKDLLMCGSA